MSWSLFEGSDRDQPATAAVLILGALAVLSFQDALVKFVAPHTSLWQFQILRALFNLSFVALILTMRRQLVLFLPRRPRAVAVRTVVMVTTMIFFFAGAPFLTLAEMGAGLYTYPIFNTALSWLILRERVGPWRIGAVFLAAVGALLIIRPAANDFSAVQLLPVAAGFFYAVNSILLRGPCRAESPLTLAAWVGLGFLVACGIGAVTVGTLDLSDDQRAAWPFLLNAWPGLTLFILGLAALASVCNVIGNVLIVKGYQSGELSWLAPFDYSYLILATFWGYVLFAELPDQIAIAGMSLIAVGGIMIAWRENSLKRRAGPTSSAGPMS